MITTLWHKLRMAAVPVLIGIFCLIPLWSAKYPPLLDYPYHLLRVKIALELHLPGNPFAKFYNYQWFPRSYLAFDAITAALSPLFGLFTAGKMALSLYLLFFVIATFYALRLCRMQIFPFVLWPVLWAYNWWFAIGAINLIFGYCFAILAIAEIVSSRAKPTRAGTIRLLIWMGCALLSHPMAFIFQFTIALCLWCSYRVFLRRRSLLIATIVTIAMCLCGSIVVHHILNQSWNLALIYNRTKWMFHDFNPAIETPLMAACMMAAIVVWLLGRKNSCRRYYILPLYVLSMVLMLPSTYGVIEFSEMRMGMFGIFLLPLFMPPIQSKKIRIALSILFVATGIIWNYGQIQKGRYYAPVYNELEQIAPHIPLGTTIRQVQNFTGESADHASHYVALMRGGFLPFSFISPMGGLTYNKTFNPPVESSMNWPDTTTLAFYQAILVNTAKPAVLSATTAKFLSTHYEQRFTGTYYDLYLKRDSMVR